MNEPGDEQLRESSEMSGEPPVRDAMARDADAIARLQIASWRAAYRGILTDAFLDGPVEQERSAVWAARFRAPPRPDQVTVLVEPDHGGAPLGFCCILAGHDPVWGSLIDNLHVAPGLWGRGLGRRLLAEAASRIPAAHGTVPVHLTVFEANPRARAAYDRWGGTVVEQFLSMESDGNRYPVLRYSWSCPRDLLTKLDGVAGE